MSRVQDLKNSMIGAVRGGLVNGVSQTAGISALGDLLSTRARLELAQDPQKAYMFSAYISGGISQILGDIGIYVKGIQIPEQRVELLTLHKRNTKKHYAGRNVSTHQISITFWDDEGLTVDTYLRQWFSLLHTKKEMTGIQALKSDYIANIQLELKDSNDVIITRRVTLINAFLISIDNVELNYDSNDPVSLTATFAFDDREVS